MEKNKNMFLSSAKELKSVPALAMCAMFADVYKRQALDHGISCGTSVRQTRSFRKYRG